MTQATTNYWTEAVASSLEEHGITATTEQINSIANDMQIAQDNMSLAFHVPEHPAIAELARIQRQLTIEKSKTVCPTCMGHGRIVHYFLDRSSDSQCDTCHGEGKIVP